MHPLKGAVMTPANLVTQSLLNALCTMPRTIPQPKIITLSVMGLTRASYASLPLLLKPVYSFLLPGPQRDKLGSERVVSHCAGWEWDAKNLNSGEPSDDIMGFDWKNREGLPAEGSLKRVLVIRPALLTDGDCVADKAQKAAYRVGEEVIGAWTVSRKDVAHFVVDAALNRWDEFEGKCVSIAY